MDRKKKKKAPISLAFTLPQLKGKLASKRTQILVIIRLLLKDLFDNIYLLRGIALKTAHPYP